MFVVRPVAGSDIAALAALSAAAPGVYTQPRTREATGRAVERSMASFAAPPGRLAEESYFFVLEDTADGAVAGAATIFASAGGGGSFFAFRNDVFSQVSRDLDISHNVHALTLCSGLTGWSQLSGFAMRAGRAGTPEGALLSRARLLFAAAAPRRFGDRFFAAMPGVTQDGGRSPFWEALGRKFFRMDFLDAERMIDGARNRTLIVELMPHYPVYVPLLPEEAQAVLGQVHAAGRPAFRILLDEGFEADDYVDIFDGGPILQAHRHALRSFSHAMPRTVGAPSSGAAAAASPCLVATAREARFRAVLAACDSPELSDAVALPPEAMRCLDVGTGDAVLCVRL